MSASENAPVVDRTLEYSEQEWEEESYALFVERAAPRPCPHCGRTGFYGPRAADPGKKYRACRFCGFWQFVGEAPIQYRPTAHGCPEWPDCARAPYIWWIDPDEKAYTCPYCDQQVVVETQNTFRKGALVLGPSEDLSHPWRKVPQGRDYDYYQRLWENWAITRGRVVL